MKKLLGIVVLGLLLCGNSNACDKEDFIKYVSAGKNKCIAILNLGKIEKGKKNLIVFLHGCLLYTSPSPRDRTRSRMPSSA